MGGSDLDRYMRDLPTIQAVKTMEQLRKSLVTITFRNILDVVNPPFDVSRERFAAMVCQASRHSPWRQKEM